VNRDVRNTQAGLIAEVRDIWDAKAAFWDERMGEGNAFQLHSSSVLQSSASLRFVPRSKSSMLAAAMASRPAG
jgi:hypothetical protein